MDELIKVLQASFAPCVLISGLGLLLLTLANRLARPIDRIRLLCRELERASSQERGALEEQILTLYRRSRFLQFSMALVTASIFLVSAIILALFSAYIFDVNLALLVKLLFAVSLFCLMVALFLFLLDLRFVLNSIRLEIDRAFRK